jgi:hypothetical protein
MMRDGVKMASERLQLRLHSTKERCASHNAGADSLFVFPIFCHPWGKNDFVRPSVLIIP